MNQQEKSIGFIGAGNLAGCLLSGLVATAYPNELLWLSNPNSEKLDALNKKHSVNVTTSNQELAEQVDIIVLSVKPNKVCLVLDELAPVIRARHPLVISVAAGVNCNAIQKIIGKDINLVRCMPNIAAQQSQSATACFAANNLPMEAKTLVERLFAAIGTMTWVTTEKHIDIATAIAGSGPAYFIFILEAMQKAARDLGLPEQNIDALLPQTLIGAGQLAQTHMHDLSALRESVTSKGGTTEAALKVLKNKNIADFFEQAVIAAYQRADALSTGE